MVEIIGHRGCRGLRPENSLPAIRFALEHGADAVEIDVGVTADDVVVAYHDYRLNSDFTRDASMQWVTEPGPLLKNLTFSELRNYDVGRLNPDSDYSKELPAQKSIDGTRIPSLEEVAQLLLEFPDDKIFYVEAKHSVTHPELAHDCDRFADAVAEEIIHLNIASRTIVESFDWHVLKRIQRRFPEIRTSPITALNLFFSNVRSENRGAWTLGYLLRKCGNSLPRLVQQFGDVTIWCSYYQDINQQIADEAHDLGLSVLVWTVNDATDMLRMIEIGVDGIVTDYPDRLLSIMKSGT